MNKPTLIPEKIAVLTQAKEELRKGLATGLCSAIVIGRTEMKSIFPPDVYARMTTASVELGDYVRKSLDHHSWLGDWQEANGFGRRNIRERQYDRMAWIDWMIQCYREDLQP